MGKIGGQKSKRVLNSETARKMVCLREARRAFKKYHAQCFWSYDTEYKIMFADISWVAEQLMKNGNRALWQIGVKLCR
ncbi:MAG: hypothetical protein A2504_12330 [Bdellovibrionales bacterium RIFOXYD12_FULL_39_22]|nr:MAG: hypothetical protein A2385_09335 [Bdellovibrionales bacterium RIFOXYB1_FULL_39_21]OFZ44980.1 MAG: hypothetical protein A2485_14400 [Bdellovibrionales bacterium RIFOXYC12_FULL_39_17]OFZ49159.1 MAG: hypothetical protein A2404_07900 [Bdellovibrionales bacterium RIFOXYC1_FULL_39_130]OFZ76960.1 MAG: hypothetical protein A2560_03935 [Bdellovibrionales bacterium RIFOXYD1_FULL_39_84]OFZ96150.1 MAG: hypothetical protein A2504_12330 [Bdellovibrionales bacterium RIFOXYD12_FULL_39_22]